MTKPEAVTELKFYTCQDVMRILGVSRNTAYSIMKTINAKLEKQHKLTIKGKVSAYAFNQMF